jgi:glycerophosphoryl diester phosphodiesterase
LPEPALAKLAFAHLRPLAGFSLLFRVVEGFLFLPVAALAGRWLLGTSVVDSTAVVSELLSPRGILLALSGSVLFFAIRYFEHAGLAAILFEAAEGRSLRAAAAFRLVIARLPALVGVAGRLTLLGLIALLPMIVALGAGAVILSGHDINYYLSIRPPRAVLVLFVVAVAAVASAALLLLLVARVRLVVEVVLFEDLTAHDAMVRSAELTRGIRWQIAIVAIALVLVTLLLGALASLLGTATGRSLLALARGSDIPLGIAFLLLLLLRSMLSLVATWGASLLDAILFTALYRRRSGRHVVPVAEQQPSVAHIPVPLLLAGLAGLAAAGGGLDLALDLAGLEQPVSVHAHRGTVGPAPENSIAAFEEAVRLGADFVETDVQLTRDGTLVLAHDADLARVAGDSRRVADLTAADVAAIRLHGGEPLATLSDALRALKGRAGLNIELKQYRDSPPGLVPAVVAAVRAAGMEDAVVVQTFKSADLEELSRLAPDIPAGFLMSVPSGSPFRIDADFLSVERRLVNARFVANAHRAGKRVFVWTVSRDPEVRRMLRLGVDGLITDNVVAAVSAREDWRHLDPGNRTIARMQTLLAG